jgi:hypothetical protein
VYDGGIDSKDEGGNMSTYQVSIAQRLERMYYYEIEAGNSVAAEEAALKAHREADETLLTGQSDVVEFDDEYSVVDTEVVRG